MSGPVSPRIQRRIDVTPVLVGYCRMLLSNPEPMIAALETGIVPSDTQSTISDTFWGLVSVAKDVTAELVERGYAPHPRDRPDSYYLERARGVKRETHELADFLRETTIRMNQLRSWIERGM